MHLQFCMKAGPSMPHGKTVSCSKRATTYAVCYCVFVLTNVLMSDDKQPSGYAWVGVKEFGNYSSGA